MSAVAISRDGRHALSGSYDRTMRFWDLATGEPVRTIGGHQDSVGAVALTPDGRHALSGSSDMTIRLWELERQLQILDFRRTYTRSDVRGFKGMHFALSHSHWVNTVAITADGQCALSGSHDRTLKLWNLGNGELIRSFFGHTDSVYAVAIAEDNRHALSGSADRTLKLWNLATGQLLHSFTEHSGPVNAVTICPDGRHGLSGSDDHTLRLWDLENKVCRAVTPLESAPLAIGLAPDGRTVVVGDRLGNVHRFEIHVNMSQDHAT